MAKKNRRTNTWKKFREFYERHIGDLSGSSQDEIYRVLGDFESTIRPRRVEDVDGADIELYVDDLRRRGLSKATIQKKMRWLKSIFRFGRDVGAIENIPVFPITRGKSAIPSRAVTDAEFRRILAVVPAVRLEDAGLWARLLIASNNADLRIGELLALSWEPQAKVRLLRLPEGRPVIHFTTEAAQKGWYPGPHAISRKFWDVASCDDEGCEIANPQGFVFPMHGFDNPHVQRCHQGVSAIIRHFGESAGVVTNEYTGKTATAHEIGRKAFIQRILKDKSISPFETRKIVRHKSLNTTMKHYEYQDAYELGRHLGWED